MSYGTLFQNVSNLYGMLVKWSIYYIIILIVKYFVLLCSDWTLSIRHKLGEVIYLYIVGHKL